MADDKKKRSPRKRKERQEVVPKEGPKKQKRHRAMFSQSSLRGKLQSSKRLSN